MWILPSVPSTTWKDAKGCSRVWKGFMKSQWKLQTWRVEVLSFYFLQIKYLRDALLFTVLVQKGACSLKALSYHLFKHLIICLPGSSSQCCGLWIFPRSDLKANLECRALQSVSGVLYRTGFTFNSFTPLDCAQGRISEENSECYYGDIPHTRP